MDQGYAVFCLADPDFYDSPTVNRGDDADFDVALRAIPGGWERHQIDDWLYYQCEGAKLPPQGWKIHVSASLDEAGEVLPVVFDYCVSRRVPFKFVRSWQLYFLANTKYVERGSSGKLVTIYPADEAQLEQVLGELGTLLDGRPGPYVLSDLRWGNGPLFVRYGGFAERWCAGADGELTLAIADATGQLVPDQRGPSFQLPPWVELPGFLAPHLAARNATTIEGLPYRIERALHFSNGGGVYAGVEVRTGQAVVLKEARPHAGLSWDRADAVTRLERERDALERLAGLDLVPPVHDYFTLGEHHFLVEGFVEGTSLNAEIVDRYPLLAEDPSPGELADYTAWALDVYHRVEQAVAAVHGRGLVIGDLHPANVLVRPDGRLTLIDLEAASVAGDARPQSLADPSFMAPRSHTGFDVDRHALACLRLYLFLPLTTLLGLDRAKAHQLAAAAAEAFPVPPEFVAEAARVIAGPDRPAPRPPVPSPGPPVPDPTPAGWEGAAASMVRAIEASATPGRDDRLFPGDPGQFHTGGLNIAYGAAGVLYALAATGAGRYPDYEEWLVRRATAPRTGTRLGFYDGLHGVAFVLDHLGRRDDALRVLGTCLDELAGKEHLLGLDLYGGLPGMALNLVHFAGVTGDASLWERAWRITDIVADRLGHVDSVAPVSGGDHPYAGLVRGSSGRALLFLRLFERSGDARLLDLAATALRQDLRRCVRTDDGSLEVDEQWRTMPYLADGSVGIGLVLADYLTHRVDEQFAEAAAAIGSAARGRFYVESGLFYGRAGMILHLSRGHPPGTAAQDPAVAGHIRRLAWHALAHRGHLAFPGEQLMRLSMDLATGTAGVLLALGAALHHQPVHLPFLAPAAAAGAEGLDLATTERR